jgi:hypothetical protein
VKLIANERKQLEDWSTGVNTRPGPMVRRRVPVTRTFTLRALHGVVQVAMGWDGFHLYQFRLRSRPCGRIAKSIT